jgi:hypothetical protein
VLCVGYMWSHGSVLCTWPTGAPAVPAHAW